MSADALRAIRRLLPDAEILQHSTPEAALYGGAYSEPPTLRQATIAEGATLRAIRVPNAPEVRFKAFLDGIQHVRILSHWRGVPIILGTVAAVVRVRERRRFVTWEHRGPIIARRLYLPRCYIPGVEAADIDGFEIVDTAETPPGTPSPSRHPGALRACAIDRIRADRERLERRLAAAWCAHEDAPICIDGGVSGIHMGRGRGEGGNAACAVGVIKSHQTLYADGDALTAVLSLAAGERSSVFQIEPRRLSSGGGSAERVKVVSWYLRMRDPHGEDAMFGLVRVEAVDVGEMTARANDISSWILAESAPLSLPDGRWDKMMYGIRDCEEFLRAIAS